MAFARCLRQNHKNTSAKALDLDLDDSDVVRSADTRDGSRVDPRQQKDDAASADGKGASQSAASGALSYRERMQLALAVGRCQHQQRMQARRDDPQYQQKCREREEQREAQRQERAAQKEKEKEEAERAERAEREAEAARREQEALREVARRQRAEQIALEIQLKREKRAQEEKLRFQREREERFQQRELSKARAAAAAAEKRRAEDFRLLITLLDPAALEQASQDTGQPPPKRPRRTRNSSRSRSGLERAAVADKHKSEQGAGGAGPSVAQQPETHRWEQRELDALYASDDDAPSHGAPDESLEGSNSGMEVRQDSIVEHESMEEHSAVDERDLAVRHQAAARISEVLLEAASAANNANCSSTSSSTDNELSIVPHSNNLSVAASVLEEEANNVARSGYRTRIRDLVTALRRAPNAGPQARELLMHILAGDLAAARQFAALRPEALLTPEEQEARRLAEEESLRATIIRPEDEGLPLVVRQELVCPACGVEAPRLQFVGFCREIENVMHGTHGGVGAQRYNATCGACLHSWFHMEGSTEHHD